MKTIDQKRRTPQRLHKRGVLAALICGAAIIAGTRSIGTAPETAPGTVVKEVVTDVGARPAFEEYEAESAHTNGEVVGADHTVGSLTAEASGRRSVRLAGPDQFVAFTLTRAANAVTLRYAIPDAAQGGGMDATLGLYVDGERVGSFQTTSRYSWVYGENPFTNNPADGVAHHIYDHARLLLDRTLPAGTVVEVRVGSTDKALWYLVDLADFELVAPPLAAPAEAVSVTDFGADPQGARDSLGAFTAAVQAGRRERRPVWIPPGRYRVDGHVEVDQVTVRGAGPWYSVVGGAGVGFYGRYAPNPSSAVILRDFAIIGEVTDRDDRAPLSGVGGSLGSGSRLDNLWIQHQKTGVWIDGPVAGLRIANLRIFDTTADGINFRRGVSDMVVENSFVRGTGDDGIASWSRIDANHHIAFRRNTVVAPTLANGIALYGGHDLEVRGNLIADTVLEGGGLHVGNRFEAVPLSGPVRLANNLLVRTGGTATAWPTGMGALWFQALDHPIDAEILISDLRIRDSQGAAIQFKGKPISGLRFTNIAVHGARELLEIGAAGSASFTGVRAEGVGGNRTVVGCRPDFRLRDAGGNDPVLNACGDGAGAD